MAHTTRTRELAAGAVPTPAAPGRVLSADSALDRLWHLLTSMKLALVLILALAALSLVGTLLMQMPAGVADDPQARATWLAGVRPKYGGWTDVLDRLQFFTMFTSAWLRGLGALLAASLVACTVQRIPGTWRTMRRPHVAVGPAFFEHAPQHEAMTFHGAPDEVLPAVRGVFSRHHYRTLVEDDGTVHLYFDRNRWAPWAGLVAHVSIVVILAGAMVGSMFGFRDSNFMLAEGSTSAIPSKAGATITLNSFQDTYSPSNGAPLDYVSDVTVKRDGQVVAQQQVRVNQPLQFENVTFYQSFFGPAADVTAKDAAGTTLFSGGVPLAWTSDNGGNKVGTFALPGQNLTAWVVATTGVDDPSVKPGQVGIELYKADTGAAVVQQSIDQGAPTTVDGLTFTFDRESKYTGLSIASDPGAPLVWLGCLLLVLGFVVRLYVPYRRIWGRMVTRPDGGTSVSIAAVGRRDSGFDAEFTSLVTDIRQAATGPAGS